MSDEADDVDGQKIVLVVQGKEIVVDRCVNFIRYQY